MDCTQMMAEWKPQQFASTQTSGGPATALWGLDNWTSLTPNWGRSDSRSRIRSRREYYFQDMGWKWWRSLAIHKPLIGGRHIRSQAPGNSLDDGSIERRRFSSPPASNQRFTGLRDTRVSPGTKKQTTRPTWSVRQRGTRQQDGSRSWPRIRPDGSRREGHQPKRNGNPTSAAST